MTAPDDELIELLLSYAPYFYQGKPLVPKVCSDAASRITELKALISEKSIERLAEDIAIACVDCRPEIREARHRAMVRLGERLRNPLKRDIAFALSTPLQGEQGMMKDSGQIASRPRWRDAGVVRECREYARDIASGIEAGTDETAKQAQPAGREPGPSGDARTPVGDAQ